VVSDDSTSLMGIAIASRGVGERLGAALGTREHGRLLSAPTLTLSTESLRSRECSERQLNLLQQAGALERNFRIQCACDVNEIDDLRRADRQHVFGHFWRSDSSCRATVSYASTPATERIHAGDCLN
jgi:hypothetical protein